MRHYCLSIAHLLQSLLVLRGHETWLNHGVGGEQPLEHQSHEFDIIQNKAHNEHKPNHNKHEPNQISISQIKISISQITIHMSKTH